MNSRESMSFTTEAASAPPSGGLRCFRKLRAGPSKVSGCRSIGVSLRHTLFSQDPTLTLSDPSPDPGQSVKPCPLPTQPPVRDRREANVTSTETEWQHFRSPRNGRPAGGFSRRLMEAGRHERVSRAAGRERERPPPPRARFQSGTWHPAAGLMHAKSTVGRGCAPLWRMDSSKERSQNVPGFLEIPWPASMRGASSLRRDRRSTGRSVRHRAAR